MRRRHVVTALGVVLIRAAPSAGAASVLWRSLAIPQAMAQIAAGGPTGLLAVGVDGTLYALPSSTGPLRRLAEDMDPATAPAIGHDRIAGRRRDGALIVLEAGRSAVSAAAATALAPAAGLLVLPLAVIGVDAQAGRHRVVRFEPARAGVWHGVARSDHDVLPDARPLLADLDGSGDGGHVVVLAGPDSERYPHGVLGDGVEATRIVVLERHALSPMRELTLAVPHVFEDIGPRRLTLGGRDALLTILSGPQGARLVVVEADPSSAGELRVASRGPELGMANRWLSPITDGSALLAVHTPHIGGVLHAYRRDGDRLVGRAVQRDVSNHRIGSRLLDESAWQGPDLVVPDRTGRRLLLLSAKDDWRVVGEQDFGARVTSIVGLGATPLLAVLLDDGSVQVGALAPGRR